MKMNFLKLQASEMGGAAIELYGNERIIIFDCKCIIDYTENNIVLDIGNKKLKIEGENLIADSFAFGQTDIKGEIKCLKFI